MVTRGPEEFTKQGLMKKALNNAELIHAEKCRRSLFYFMRYFWDVVCTDEPKWNWHIPYLCSQLMKVARRVGDHKPKLYDPIINVPPGTTKSMTCSIMFPAWCWTNWPWMRFITSSYSSALSLELAEYSRDIIRSAKYQRLFPEIEIKRDKDTKSNFSISKKVFAPDGSVAEVIRGGNRYSTSVGGTLTGFHGHILIVDDPLDPNRANSQIEIQNCNHWIDQTLSTRKIEKSVTPTILIMQRLADNDPSGHLLKKKNKQIFHICLPGEIKQFGDLVKPKHLISQYKDQLLDPVRIPWSVLKDLEADLGQYGYAGQIGQSPIPAGGGMFKVDMIPIVHHCPKRYERAMTVRYWDKAGSQGKGCFTAGVKMVKLMPSVGGPEYLIEDVKHGQWSTEERERIIKATAEADGHNCIVYIEQEPGSGGKESAENTIKNLAGFTVFADKPTGDKIYRADPFSVQVNVGNVAILNGVWNQVFLDELKFFPDGPYKDQVDAASAAFNKLASKRQAGSVLS
jgi:predicted phage terminase large subunit-like protein